MLAKRLGAAVQRRELSVSMQDVSHSYPPGCNPGATPASGHHPRRVHLLNKMNDVGDGLDYPQRQLAGRTSFLSTVVVLCC